MTRLIQFWLMWGAVCLECSGAGTNREVWNQAFSQASLAAFVPDRLGHVTAVLYGASSNSVVLLNSDGTIFASASFPYATNLPSPVQGAAADFAGNIYLSGPANVTAAHVSTLKFRPNLASIAWTNVMALTNSSAPGRLGVVRQMIADDAGNAYCLGRFNQYPGDIDQFMLSVGPAGPRWFNGFNPDQDNDFDKGIALLSAGDGSLFAVGNSDHYLPSGSSVIVRRFTPGGQLIWASNYLATAKGAAYDFSETPAAAVLDSLYRLVIAGGRIEGFDRAYFVMQLSSTGRILWRTIIYNLEDNFAATDVGVDDDDNVIVTGAAGTVKLSPAGAPLWFSPLGANAVRVTQSNDFVLSGTVRDGNGPRVVQTTKLLANGQTAWSARFTGSPGSDNAFAGLLLDSTGGIYVAVTDSNKTTTVLNYREPPRLVVKAINGSQISVSWSMSEGACALMTAPSFDVGEWGTITNAPVRAGEEWTVTLPKTNDSMFFKLELR